MQNNKAINFLMKYGFEWMTNVKGNKKSVHIEIPSEAKDKEIERIMVGTDTEIDHFLSGRLTTLVNDDLIIYIKEVF